MTGFPSAPRCVAVTVAALLSIAIDAAAQATVEGTVLWRGSAARGAVVSLGLEDVRTALPRIPDTVTIDQRHLRFEPDLLVIRVGTAVRFPNSDRTMHSVFSPRKRGAGFDLGTFPWRETRTFVFQEPGEYVILCRVHPEMAAWIVVRASPYQAISGADGTYRIQGVPAGRYRLVAWHSRAGRVERDLMVPAVGGARHDVDLDPPRGRGP